MRLSARQAELLKRACLKRYRVTYEGYMGSWRPNESIVVYALDDTGKQIGPADHTFRPSTYNALRDKGLARARQAEMGRDNTTEVKPTREGLALYVSTGGKP